MAWRVALGLLSAAVYFGTPKFSRPAAPAYEHFPRLAHAFLTGRLSIEAGASRGRIDELIPSPTPDRFYCPYPPLPAVLLAPFVAILGGVVTTAAACRALSTVNVLLFDACLERLPRFLNLPPFDAPTRVAVDLFFAFGTVTWHNAHMGGDWHLAHAVTLAAGLLALREFLGAGRPMAIGAFVAAILLTRPTAALACVAFVLPLLRGRKGGRLARLLAMPALGLILLGAYNAARFGDPLDFGYDRMILAGKGKELMEQYGQFSVHYISRNFFWFFLAPSWPRMAPGFPIGFDPRGLSLFVASPALLYAFAGVVQQWNAKFVRHAALGIALCLVPLLMYFNTGFWQFGHRFSMDYMAPMMMLVALGIAARPSRAAILIIAMSIAFQFVGVVLQPIARLPDWLAS